MTLEITNKRIQLPASYDLNGTLLSSFACYLFKQVPISNGTAWSGIVSGLNGVELRQVDHSLLISYPEDMDSDYITRFVTGLWHQPEVKLRANRPQELLRKVDLLANSIMPGIRVPWLREHKWEVLLSCMLSIHAKMDLSRKWFESLSNMKQKDFLSADPLDLRQLTKDKTGISAGYRMRYIVETVRDLFDKHPGTDNPLELVCRNRPAKVRTELTKVRNIGPKVADCFLLNAMGDVSATPIDVNVKRVAEYLQLVPKDLGMPAPILCRNFACRPEDATIETPLCPKAERTIEYLEGKGGPGGTCIRAAFSNTYSDTGWVQAEVFAFARNFCVPVVPPCDSCLLKPDCKREEIIALRGTAVRRPRAPGIRSYVTSTPIFAWNTIDLLEAFPEHSEEVMQLSKELFDKAVQMRDRHMGSSALSASCVWLACRLKNLPVILEEICRAYATPKEALLHVSSHLRFGLELVVPPADLHTYCNRFIRELGLDSSVTREVEKTVSALHLEDTSGRNPMVLTAAIIFTSLEKMGKALPLTEIAKEFGVSEVSVRGTSKMIRGRRNLEIVE